MQETSGMVAVLFRYVLGFCFSTIVAHFLIKMNVMALWKTVDPDSYQDSGWVTLSTIQGIVERVLYTSAMLAAQPAFIALWVALKVASQWESWKNKPGYNAFLVGTGLSILFGVSGAVIIAPNSNAAWQAIAAPIALVLFSLALFLTTKLIHAAHRAI